MLTRRILDGTTTDDGRELELSQRGEEYLIQIDRWELMSSRSHGSEEAMARLALAALGERRDARWLVGGLGMGYTLRACLDALESCVGSSVIVVEVFAALVEWNRGPLGHLASHPLKDPRVRVEIGDVYDQLAPATDESFDVILLDVDNGPEALTLMSNQRLYQERGLARLRAKLSAGGVLAIWSASDDARFQSRLGKAGFRVDRKQVRSGQRGRGERHTIFVAQPR